MTAAKKPVGRRLGRGLGSLINAPVTINQPEETASPSADGQGSIRQDGVSSIPVEQVVPNQRQPRQRFRDEGPSLPWRHQSRPPG